MNQDAADAFIRSNNNNVSRAFLKNILSICLDHKELFTPEEMNAIRDIKIQKLKGTSKHMEKKIITRDNIEQIAGLLKLENARLMFLLSYYCALRVSELFLIEKDDFNWLEWEKDINQNGTLNLKETKGGGNQIVIVPNFLMVRISNYILNFAQRDIDKTFEGFYLFNLLDWQPSNDEKENLKYIKKN